MFTKVRVLFWLGLLCFVPFFFPMFQHVEIPNGTDEIFTLGIPASPWLEHHETETETKVETEIRDEKAGRFSQVKSLSSSRKAEQHTFIQWLSWSWLFAFAGVIALCESRRMKAAATSKKLDEKGA
jgi:hypothetical protein